MINCRVSDDKPNLPAEHVMMFFLRTEIQTKRQERKRRSTANPAYSGLFEPEVRKLQTE